MASKGFIGGLVSAFGGSDKPPEAVYFPGGANVLADANRLSRDTFQALRPGLADFRDSFARGTERQLGLQDEQADIFRGLTQRALNRDPQQQLRETGNTLFNFIDPNVIEPLARADVNRARVTALRYGLNQDVADSTANRLRNARISSGRLYDVARDVYSRLPQIYQQVRDAGITDEMLAAGYIPQIQAGYRNIDMAPLVPLQASVALTRNALGIPVDLGAGNRALAYGFHQPRNLADRFGEAGENTMNFLQDAAAIYGQLYGSGALSGFGGGAVSTAGMPRTIPPPPAAPSYDIGIRY